MADYIIPVLLAAVSCMALAKGENSYGLLTEGGAKGLRLIVTLAPALVTLLTAVSMLRASGALDAACRLLSPALSRIGIPPETALLILVRPISGSAALAVGAELIARHGADSLVGRTAAVMLGSTETTFYTVSIYFGACGIRKTRYAVPAALIADAAGFLAAAWSVRWFY